MGAVVLLAAGIGLSFYFRNEKARLDRQRVAEAAKGVGKPKIGGKFALVDQEGNSFTDADMKGGHTLVRISICVDRKTRLIDSGLGLLWLLPLPGYLP